jgi:tetratricopeptide (TPR) repeat protein
MNPMSRIKDLHHEAMRLADQASDLRRRGEEPEANARLHQALEHERQAAELAAADLALEPTRSVLHRSAATLAWQCGEYREAERLITTALSGTPPETIAEELRDLLLQVYFEQSPRNKRRSLSAPPSPGQSS